jgi:hypothetical protein
VLDPRLATIFPQIAISIVDAGAAMGAKAPAI